MRCLTLFLLSICFSSVLSALTLQVFQDTACSTSPLLTQTYSFTTCYTPKQGANPASSHSDFKFVGIQNNQSLIIREYESRDGTCSGFLEEKLQPISQCTQVDPMAFKITNIGSAPVTPPPLTAVISGWTNGACLGTAATVKNYSTRQNYTEVVFCVIYFWIN
mmetsp:Transcript_5131/g.5582  ORF Transcript_5131/g.5582 Transcript_5131/m.5582 type:complete len:163 (-) Transcript_5131:38-526(-)